MLNPSIKYPDSLLKFLRKEELEIISKLFHNTDLGLINIEKELSKSLLPANGLFQRQLTYNEILDKLIKKKNISSFSNDSIHQKEEKILLYKFKKILENLTPEEKIKFDKEVLKYSNEHGISKEQVLSINAISTLTIANLSGFGLYLMASTVVGGLTSVLGITLPFVFYTSMSSVLSIITGPVGWTVGLGYIAYSFRNDNFESASNKIYNYTKSIKNTVIGNVEHTMLAVSFIASCRIILKEENIKRKKSLEKQKTELDNQTKDLKLKNIELDKRLEELRENIAHNKIKIEEFNEKSFEIEVEIRKANNFINQTLI
ncbi:MAG: hypothetical protein Q8J84_08775 [Flavobacteriaceae bacterium]|nr:hypothetical protein [Flavobacteriaceae bacterium]